MSPHLLLLAGFDNVHGADVLLHRSVSGLGDRGGSLCEASVRRGTYVCFFLESRALAMRRGRRGVETTHYHLLDWKRSVSDWGEL